jgi:hypothetical protein
MIIICNRNPNLAMNREKIKVSQLKVRQVEIFYLISKNQKILLSILLSYKNNVNFKLKILPMMLINTRIYNKTKHFQEIIKLSKEATENLVSQ